MDAERLGNWRHDGSGFQLGLTNLRDLSSVDPADSAAWRPVVRAADGLATASSKASAVLNASCPNQPPLTPLVRLDAVERRLEATIRAIEIVRPALATLYDSLNDEQRQRLDAIGAEDIGHGRGTAANGSSGATNLASLCSDQAANFTRLPVQRIEEVVKPTGQQQSALERLKQTSENAADELRASCPTRTAEAPVARADEMHNRLGAMVQAVKNLRPTLGTFYASLSDEQKAQFNTMGSRTRGIRMTAGRSDPTAFDDPHVGQPRVCLLAVRP